MKIELRPTQKKYFRECLRGHYFNFAWGPVRSGKTFTNNLLWANFMANEVPEGKLVIMAGQSNEALYNNVIRDIIEMEPETFDYIKNPGQLIYKPRNVKAICVGASNESDWKRITGPTAHGVYFNELPLIPETFFNMAMTRVTFKPILNLADGNPLSPGHFAKRRLIDRAGDIDCHHQFFTFIDNPVLSQEYIDRLHSMYSGVFYKRNVLGEWCSGEGMIYSDAWEPDKYIVPWFDTSPYQLYPRYRVVDFGFALHHAFCCQRWLHIPQGIHIEQHGRHFWGPCFILYRERYHHGMTNEQHARIIAQEDKGDRFAATLCDHDPDAIQTIRHYGMGDARMANKRGTVGNGIQLLHNAISRGQIYIMDGARSHPADPALVAAGLPTCTAEEIPRLSWATTMKGEYEREDYAPGSAEHGAKNISYLLNSVSNVKSINDLKNANPESWE